MQWFDKNKPFVLLLLLLIVFYLFTRLFHIMSFPIFTDEAIYVRWAQIAKNDPSMRFISLTDGKQPSFVWLTMVVMRFVSDPLLAGRLVSVGTGLISMVGLFFLANVLFKNYWIGLASAILYAISPFALVYDRMALYDSLVGAFALWGLLLAILLAKKVRLDVAILFGMVVGGGLITKTSALFSLYLLPITLLLFRWDLEKRKRLLTWAGLAFISIGLALGFSLILKLSPLSYMILDKNALFIYHLSELLPYRAFSAWPGNLVLLGSWLVTYMTFPIVLLIVISPFLSPRYRKEIVVLFLWFAIPFVFLALFGRILHPRFIFFMTLPLLPLAAVTLYKLRKLINNNLLLASCYLLLAILPLRADYFILTNIAYASIPQADLEQYINDWPAGGGIEEIVIYLGGKAQSGKIAVVSEGTFGSLPTTALDIYFDTNPNVAKYAIASLEEKMPKQFLTLAKTMPVYVIFNQQQQKPAKWPLVLVARYQKGRGNSYASLYQVDPSYLDPCERAKTEKTVANTDCL